jgi:solute carrier family 34 (sodium-dependent phosphate cotransporter)
MNKKEIIFRVILLVIILYFFLVSIKLLGGSFKLFGQGFAKELISFTGNPLVGLFIGILATSLVQSSSATTSLIVGLVAAGGLPITIAIPMIMGANIGTSITNTIVSLAHITKKSEFKKAFEVATIHDFFNIIVVAILLPLEIYFHILEKSALALTSFVLGSGTNLTFKSPLDYIVKPVADSTMISLNNNAIIILIFSLSLLFFSLRYFVKIMKPLVQTEFKHLIDKHLFKNWFRSFMFGLLLTVVAQSSSVTTSLAVPLAGVGIITLRKMFPYILGANIGTTFTALIAASVTGSSAAVTIALAHLLFNVYGIVIVVPIRRIPLWLSEKVADISLKSKFIPLTYIGTVFYLIPLAVVFFLH